MQLTSFLPLAFAASAFAANFVGYSDTSCQRTDETYVLATAEQLKDLTLQQYPTAYKIPEASRAFDRDYARCPINEDDTYAWLDVPMWQQEPVRGGGKIAVIYVKATDTYFLCRHLAGVVGGYAGRCR